MYNKLKAVYVKPIYIVFFRKVCTILLCKSYAKICIFFFTIQPIHTFSSSTILVTQVVKTFRNVL